ncbi:MAG: glutathione S-transferase, partial [Burkholderiales bacterium]|nr:glutathione S-transferase [Burkholderiales bacterium]
MLKIWGRATSSNVQKVTWLLDEIGLAHERIDIGGPFGGNREASYRALNPNGLVPTLQDGDFTLWESNTICRYLANRESAHTLYPTDFRARADVERWMDWSTSMLGPALHAAFWGLIRTAPADRDLPAIRASAVKTGEAAEALVACGTRYFAARGRIEPSRGFAEVESGLRNACLRELIDFRTAALPEDASRADVNKAIRTLQAQNRRQFRAAYETAAVAELKRRKAQDAGAPPASEEQPEEQVADGAATEAQTAPAPSAA